jgi:hypothetical protein
VEVGNQADEPPRWRPSNLNNPEHGIPREAMPPHKWPGYLLAGACLASGIGQICWAVSIASTQMVGVYQRWKDWNWAPLSPALVGIFALVGFDLCSSPPPPAEEKLLCGKGSTCRHRAAGYAE